MTKKQMYVEWLNKAHAMETDIIKTLEGQIEDFKGYPEAQKMVKDHLKETKGHAEKVKRIIEKNDGKVSALGSVVAEAMGVAKSMTMDMMHDKVIKNAIANHATEHLEIASYKVLVDTAKEVGDDDSVKVFQEIISEEEKTAELLEKSMPELLAKFLKKHEDEKNDEK